VGYAGYPVFFHGLSDFFGEFNLTHYRSQV
jgi:hypothetical protein